MKKIVIIISSLAMPIIIIGLIILIACLIVLDFFGTNSTDGYVADNYIYAKDYENVLNQNIENGYVPLERILYFYLADDSLTFSQIYNDNLDLELKRMKPITEVCSQSRYKILSVCNEEEIKNSNQIDEYQIKPFVKPIDFSVVTVTSFFMKQRVVYGKFGVHKAWDFASPEQTKVYSVCDGIVKDLTFPYEQNVIDINGSGGNQIVLQCNIDGTIYNITYAHLFPKSYTVAKGESVIKGQVIAGVGMTGYATGNHLHFQVQLEDNTYLDGVSLIDFASDSEQFIPEYPKPTMPNYGY